MVCSRKTADTLLIMRHECLGECCHHVMFRIGRPCSILPTKSQSIGAAQAVTPWRPCIIKTRPARKPWLHLPHGGGFSGPSPRERTNQGPGRRKNKEGKRDEGRRGEKEQKKKKRRLRILMMLFLSPALSHWWNHMVPALSRDEFPQCRPASISTGFGDVDGWIHACSLTHSVTHLLTHIHVCTHMHTCLHAHDIHTHMLTWPCRRDGRAQALKQTRELSVHETGAWSRQYFLHCRSYLLGQSPDADSSTRQKDAAQAQAHTSKPSSDASWLLRAPMSLQPCRRIGWLPRVLEALSIPSISLP